MGKSENLKMLYLLTYADIKAVGPDVWTEWKALLLQELYEKAFEVLERGDFRFEARSERVKKVRKKVMEIHLQRSVHPTRIHYLDIWAFPPNWKGTFDIVAGRLRGDMLKPYAF